jgi:hypothetical protein
MKFKIHDTDPDFLLDNSMIRNLIESPKKVNNVFMDNILSAELSFFEISSKYLESIGMTFEFNSLFSDSYTFSMETSHWRLIVQLSRHKQPQWLFIVKNQWFLTYSQIVEDSTFPMFELPPMISENHKDSKSDTLLSDEIKEVVGELESISGFHHTDSGESRRISTKIKRCFE